ncbi:hypothetical protein BX666DRAFT_1873287 [Dichotomocladium elegans]|nr:hypothetical protein BX666DRAFT_1873287 [Dichotomocladium elegans]
MTTTTSTTTISTTAAVTTNHVVPLTVGIGIEKFDETAQTPSLVQVDRFAQLVAAHWLYDHLETIKSRSYDHIATRLGSHVEVFAVGRHDDGDDSTLVDLDILKAQIFGAIQAHIGGHLPVVWDDLSANTLSKPALEQHIVHLVHTRCPASSRGKDEEGRSIIAAAAAAAAAAATANSVEHSCLLQCGDQILAELDRYVIHHLQNVFGAMDTHVMPDLLKHTEKDLRQVIDYFNGVQQQQASSMQLALQVLPWQAPHLDAATVSSSADNPNNPVPSSFLSAYAPDDQDSHRIDQYADLAIVL